MQYELPHTSAEHEHRDPTHEASHGGHGGMSHDMSDPTLAAAIERDMRNRFFVALLLAMPVVILSPLAVNTFGLELIGSQSARNWLMPSFRLRSCGTRAGSSSVARTPRSRAGLSTWRFWWPPEC
jgi:hypothetical protein